MRGQIRRDIDETIKHCIYYSEFEKVFQSLGYTLERRGKYLRIRPDNSAKWFRMDKLGEGYTYEDVQRRLKENGINRSFTPYKTYTKREKPKGLVALYYHYCYLLGALPKEKPNNREAYATIREDVKRARMYSEEAKLLGKYDIHTAEQLSSFTENLSGRFVALAKERAALRSMHDSVEMQPIKNQISELSRQMAVLRREMRLCEDIALRSGAIEAVVNTIDIPDKDTPKKTQDRKKEERKMDGIKEMCQKKLLADNEKIIYVIISGCGGVMFLKHFYSMLGKTDTRLIERLIDKYIHRNGQGNIDDQAQITHADTKDMLDHRADTVQAGRREFIGKNEDLIVQRSHDGDQRNHTVSDGLVGLFHVFRLEKGCILTRQRKASLILKYSTPFFPGQWKKTSKKSPLPLPIFLQLVLILLFNCIVTKCPCFFC